MVPGLLEDYVTTGVAQGSAAHTASSFFVCLTFTGENPTANTARTVIAVLSPDEDSPGVLQFLVLKTETGGLFQLQDIDTAGSIAVQHAPLSDSAISIYISDNIAGQGVIHRFSFDGTTLPHYSPPQNLTRAQLVRLKPHAGSEPVHAGGLYFESDLTSVGLASCASQLDVQSGRLWVVEYKNTKVRNEQFVSCECGCVRSRTIREDQGLAYRYRIDPGTGNVVSDVSLGSVSEAKAQLAVQVPAHARGIAFGRDMAMPYMAVLRCQDSFSYQCRVEFYYHPMYDSNTNCVKPRGAWAAANGLAIDTNVRGAVNSTSGLFYVFRVPSAAVSLSRTTDVFEELVVGFNGAASSRLDAMTMNNGDKDDSFYRIRVPVLNNTKAGLQRNEIYFELLGQKLFSYDVDEVLRCGVCIDRYLFVPDTAFFLFIVPRESGLAKCSNEGESQKQSPSPSPSPRQER